MSLPPDHPYRKHAANLRVLARGLTQAERAHKAAIGSGSEVAIDFHARVHYMTVGLLAEASLRKTIADPGGFNERERDLLAEERSQLDRWKTAVELAFRRHYAVPIHRGLDSSTVTDAAAGQYAAIIDLLRRDLAEIIEDRNKIAHGQWAWLLNSKEKSFKHAAPPPLNYRAIEARSKLVTELAALIRDLVVSEPTFDRDYAKHYQAIQSWRSRLAGLDYADLVKDLRARRRRR
jgi:hypothetical protein